MKNRIAELIKAKGFTSGKFAELMEVQPSGISHILSGRNNPGYDFIERLLIRFPDISPDWLLLGHGDMYREGILPDKTLFESISQGFANSGENSQIEGHNGVTEENSALLFDNAATFPKAAEPSLFDTEGFDSNPDRVSITLEDFRLATARLGASVPTPLEEPQLAPGQISEPVLGLEQRPSPGTSEPALTIEQRLGVSLEQRAAQMPIQPPTIQPKPGASEPTFQPTPQHTSEYTPQHPPKVAEDTIFTNVNIAKEESKKAIKVILFYSDGTFEQFSPKAT